jgi:hypothetical protein
MPKEVSELEDGRIHVHLSSTRGTGTRDEDEVRVDAVYPNVETALEESWKLNELISDRLYDARKVANPPEEAESRPRYRQKKRAEVDRDIQTDNPNLSPTQAETDEMQKNQANPVPDTSKIYLGEGVELSGWIQVPREVVFEEIAPLVAHNQVSDENNGVKVNFSSDLPVSGWKTVDEDTVVDEILPLVKNNRVYRGGEPNNPDDSQGDATCPIDWCSYSGSIEQVLGHITASDDHIQDRQPHIECPVEDCHKTGPVGTIAGHFFSIWDEEHSPEKLLNTGVF